MAFQATRHLAHHVRFYLAATLGVAVWFAAAGLHGATRLLLAGDVFFISHLLMMAMLLNGSRHSSFRQRAEHGDDGLFLIAAITLIAVVLSLGSIFALINHDGPATAWRIVLSIASVPLGWLMLHVVFAFHYAHAYYGRGDRPGSREGGLQFPGDEQPQAWDFIYYAFVVGMTAQVADVNITSTSMRRLTLLHGVVSFFFNTVILAIAVNASVQLAA
jgi:uncharacterized membrane protein